MEIVRRKAEELENEKDQPEPVIRLQHRRFATDWPTFTAHKYIGECPVCGAELVDDFEYCPYCGQALKWEAEE